MLCLCKKVVFHKALLLGYVFVERPRSQRLLIRPSRHTVNLLSISDQEEFISKLALDAPADLEMSPKIISDLQIWTYSDPLCGRNEWVERRHKMTELHLQ